MSNSFFVEEAIAGLEIGHRQMDGLTQREAIDALNHGHCVQVGRRILRRVDTKTQWWDASAKQWRDVAISGYPGGTPRVVVSSPDAATDGGAHV